MPKPPTSNDPRVYAAASLSHEIANAVRNPNSSDRASIGARATVAAMLLAAPDGTPAAEMLRDRIEEEG